MLAAVAAGTYAVFPKPVDSTAAFTTIDGRRIALSDLGGRIVLVNFWATTCGTCLAEMPELIAIYRQYQPRGLEVIAVAMPYDDLQQVRQYAAKQALPFPVVFDQGGALARDYEQVQVTPVTFVIDPSGQRISKTVGVINFAKLRAFLDASLPAGRAS
ncbi:TlpA disulfide reductase family protein [Cupriavidus pauculus]|uniref:TlpA disulfide reductase family protein n=1 Tax=Cupriavidus pauculus TaxID=82633 RepID=UPI0012FD4ACF|nr:TlpA disulfide reductase family protein [Cupriavidus pauculus]